MKSLKNKAFKAMEALNAVKGSQGTHLFFQALSEETKRDLYKSIDELQRFIDNIPDKLPKAKK